MNIITAFAISTLIVCLPSAAMRSQRSVCDKIQCLLLLPALNLCAEFQEIVHNSKQLEKYKTHKTKIYEALIIKDTQKLKIALEDTKQPYKKVILNYPFTLDYRDLCGSTTALTQIQDFFKSIKEHERILANTTPLIVATFLGNAECATLLIDHGADIEIPSTYNEMRPLHLACKFQPALISLLISRGADHNAPCEGAPCPLVLTCQYNGNVEATKQLIQAGVSVNVPEGTVSPLQIAALTGKYEVAEALIKNGARIDHRSKKSAPLLDAVGYRQFHIAKLLLENGADSTIQREDGKTIIEIASSYDSSCIMPLLRRGAPYPRDQQHRNLILNALSQDHLCNQPPIFTDMIYTLVQGNTQGFIKILNERVYGNYLNVADLSGMTVLHWATVRKNEQAVDALLPLVKQSSLRSWACSIPIICEQVMHPLNLNIRDGHKRTALTWAKLLRHGTIARKLIEAGATE